MTPLTPQEVARYYRLLREAVSRHNLSLSGLTVFTELASGPYMVTPFLAHLAGAKRVIAVTRDSPWGDAGAVVAEGRRLADVWGMPNAFESVGKKLADDLATADVVTNLGFVRPVDSSTVAAMKPTAVVPLMWETWEFRPEEVDLEACREKGILVLGTDEHRICFIDYAAYVDLRLLFEAGIEVFQTRLLVFASGPVAAAINRLFRAMGLDFRYCSRDETPDPRFADLHICPDNRDALLAAIAHSDAILCDEKSHDYLLIGRGGVLEADAVARANPGVSLVFRSGSLDFDASDSAGLYRYPERQVPFGYSTVGSYYLGPRPVIELHAAGLKVAEVMARARLAGASPAQAAWCALRDSPAMDFEGEAAWVPSAGA